MTSYIDAIHAELESLPSLQYPGIAILDFIFALESGESVARIGRLARGVDQPIALLGERLESA